MQPTESPLLRQLQQRLLHLATPEVADLPVLRDLIACLFVAQSAGSGVLPIATLDVQLSAEFDTTLAELQMRAPNLIGMPNSVAPIIFFPPFVSFRRVYQQLFGIANTLRARRDFILPSDKALATIKWVFSGGALSDEQKIATFSAATQPFTIITGGAGTGKTTTLTKALELILLDTPDADILLAAPTGKAAQRLNESLSAQLDCVNDAVREKVATLHAKTLHRLLGISEHTGRASRHANNPLSCQVLAIDEASMIGSDLLAQVFEALPTNAKLILLGDANQLPPINAVAFFNEMSRLTPVYSQSFATAVSRHLGFIVPSEAIDDSAPLVNQVCRLNMSRRFAEKSLIETCADAALSRDLATLTSTLGQQWYQVPHAKQLYADLASRYACEPSALLNDLKQRIILCANRQGSWGSEAINTHLDKVFRECIIGREQTGATGKWYEGRRILIEKNHYDLQLSNGDIGCCFYRDNAWWIDFGESRELSVDLLPHDYSLAFAMTIHKSQGSEYAHIDMVLDRFHEDNHNALVTPALLYTGITRAKKSLALFGDVGVVSQAFQTPRELGESPLLQLL